MNIKAKKTEITIKAIILGVLLSAILAAANAYLGLFAGMTVSASIPAAVISMGVLRLFKNSNILENNIVQTSASAGESLAAGVIFTIPALVLMGYWESFDYFEVAKISAIGGLIGILFTIPLRQVLIVRAKLLYPEGIATAEVLKAGHNTEKLNDESTSSSLKTIGISSLIGSLMKLGQSGFSLWGSAIEGAKNFNNVIFGFGCDLSPALVSVGYIVGINISTVVFSGGLISWLFAIPIYSFINGFQGNSFEAAMDIWNSKIRYLGVGTMVIGGIWSLIKLSKPLIDGLKISFQNLNKSKNNESKDLPINIVLILLLCLLPPVILLYFNIINSLSIAIILSLVMMFFGFLFSAVASYMAGVVGSSNNPVSGVTIATILFTSLLLLLILGKNSPNGPAAAILVGAVVCCAAAIGGDNMQDLKTGYILGATPIKQQIMQVIGVLSSALVLGLVLDILHSAYTIGSPEMSAPQATLMKSVSEGVFTGNLPIEMLIIGSIIGVIIIIIDVYLEKKSYSFRIPVLAAAVGIYLPIQLTFPVFIGGLISYLSIKKMNNKLLQRRGLLLASGLITGEALMGILIALPIFISGEKNWWPSFNFPEFGIINLGSVLFISILFWFYNSTTKK